MSCCSFKLLNMFLVAFSIEHKSMDSCLIHQAVVIAVHLCLCSPFLEKSHYFPGNIVVVVIQHGFACEYIYDTCEVCRYIFLHVCVLYVCVCVWISMYHHDHHHHRHCHYLTSVFYTGMSWTASLRPGKPGGCMRLQSNLVSTAECLS